MFVKKAHSLPPSEGQVTTYFNKKKRFYRAQHGSYFDHSLYIWKGRWINDLVRISTGGCEGRGGEATLWGFSLSYCMRRWNTDQFFIHNIHKCIPNALIHSNRKQKPTKTILSTIRRVFCVQVKRSSALIQQGKSAWTLMNRLINFLQQELNSSCSRWLYIISQYMMHILNHDPVSELPESSTSVRVLWITNLCPRVLRIINLSPSLWSQLLESSTSVWVLWINSSQSESFFKPSALSLSTSFISIRPSSSLNHQPTESPGPLNHQHHSWSLEPSTSVWEAFESSDSVWGLWIINLSPSSVNKLEFCIQSIVSLCLLSM